MQNLDIRWLQRFSNYNKALAQLEKAVLLAQQRPLSDLEAQGIIQAFEYTHELAWNVMKDYFEYQGNTNITGSRDAIKEAFKVGIVADGEGWMDTIRSRNRTVHTYNEQTADEIKNAIIHFYFQLFKEFETKMEGYRLAAQTDLFKQ